MSPEICVRLPDTACGSECGIASSRAVMSRNLFARCASRDASARSRCACALGGSGRGIVRLFRFRKHAGQRDRRDDWIGFGAMLTVSVVPKLAWSKHSARKRSKNCNCPCSYFTLGTNRSFTGLLMGLYPALANLARRSVYGLKEGGRGTSGQVSFTNRFPPLFGRWASWLIRLCSWQEQAC